MAELEIPLTEGPEEAHVSGEGRPIKEGKFYSHLKHSTISTAPTVSTVFTVFTVARGLKMKNGRIDKLH